MLKVKRLELWNLKCVWVVGIVVERLGDFAVEFRVATAAVDVASEIGPPVVTLVGGWEHGIGQVVYMLAWGVRGYQLHTLTLPLTRWLVTFDRILGCLDRSVRSESGLACLCVDHMAIFSEIIVVGHMLNDDVSVGGQTSLLVVIEGHYLLTGLDLFLDAA